jgi:hypothetical protein
MSNVKCQMSNVKCQMSKNENVKLYHKIKKRIIYYALVWCKKNQIVDFSTILEKYSNLIFNKRNHFLSQKPTTKVADMKKKNNSIPRFSKIPSQDCLLPHKLFEFPRFLTYIFLNSSVNFCSRTKCLWARWKVILIESYKNL